MNQYQTISDYPNNRSAHALRIYKNGIGLCSCEHWQLDGASEANVIRNHQHHVANHEEV